MRWMLAWTLALASCVPAGARRVAPERAPSPASAPPPTASQSARAPASPPGPALSEPRALTAEAARPVVSSACVDPPVAAPFLRYRPPCDFTPATVFWRWPGNVVVVPSEAGLGSCHDDDLWFPAPSPGCAPAPGVAIREDAEALTLSAGERVPAAWAAAVQVGIVELPIAWTDAIAAEVARVTAERAVLALRVRGDFDPAELAPVADRLVGLFIARSCDSDACDTPIDLGRLPPMPALRVLVIDQEGPARDVASLARHPRLAGLGLHCGLEDGEEAELAALPGLTTVSLGGDRPRALRGLRQLRTALVVGSEANLRALAGHRRLSSLVLLEPIDERALAQVPRIPSLRQLSVGIEGMTEEGARRLARARQLRTLIVRARALAEDEAVETLARVPSLARHRTAEVVLDVDESIPDTLSAPWREVACRGEDAECTEPEPVDPSGDEVDRTLE